MMLCHFLSKRSVFMAIEKKNVANIVMSHTHYCDSLRAIFMSLQYLSGLRIDSSSCGDHGKICCKSEGTAQPSI